MQKKIVETIIHKCFGLRKNEHLLIVTDDVLFPLAYDLYKTVRAMNINGVLVDMPPLRMHGEEPPRIVRYALQKADVALLLTSKSLSHTKARKEASKKYGTRIASLPGVTLDILQRAIDVDYDVLKKTAFKLARKLSAGKQVEIYTDRGTHLSMSIKGRKGFSDDGAYTGRGAFGNLPAGEACIAPLENTCNGYLIVDGSAPMVGRVKKPVGISIENGYAKNMPFPMLERLMKTIGKKAFNVAEFGIGINKKAKVKGRILEDEKAVSTAHIALGNNKSFGGKVYCPCHLDFVFMDPVIFIDGKRVEL